MAHVRLFKHYLHIPFIILGLLESFAYMAAMFLAVYARLYIGDLEWNHNPLEILPGALVYAFTMLICMNAMGVYQAKLKEGLTGMLIRTMVAFAIGSLIFPLFYYLASDLFGIVWRSVLVLAAVFALLLVGLVRGLFYLLVDDDLFKKRVMILGAGHRAKALMDDFQNSDANKGFILEGFYPLGDEEVVVPSEMLLPYGNSIKEVATRHGVEEIVIAAADRRKKLPLDELMSCKLEGLHIIDAHTFCEREMRKVALEMISPSWFIFSDGFQMSTFSAKAKRCFDIAVSLLLLAFVWPLMLITAIFIKLEDGWKAPLFYQQIRVGLDDIPFAVNKFRSMIVAAESNGEAVWASKNDSRITRVGNVIRKYRVDELPQLFNVLKGDMAFVGPRPERPVFVETLGEKIPFYKERHRVKPGITGWAQLCFAYAESEEDSAEKLRYDLYYIKNQSLLLDILIIMQTLEVVLFKKGAQ